MGYRMYIKCGDKEYGGDHKLYAYYDFRDVKESFSYISARMRGQWDLFQKDLYKDPSEMYSLFSALSCTPDVILREEEFKTFSDLYLKDVFKNKSIETFHAVCEYMFKLLDMPGDKAIWWG